jgi:hypothetical protein
MMRRDAYDFTVILQRVGRSLAMSWGIVGDADRRRWRNRAAVAALLAFTLLVAGCGGGNLFGGPSASAPAPTPAPAPASAPAPTSSGGNWLRDDVSNFFAGSSDKAPQPVAGATPDVDCPYIQIREGASTLSINAPGDSSAMSLKYQGSFVRAARQCAVVAGQMVMKVGVEGRIVLGPQGGPGQINVPLRIAVVDEKPSATKPIVTKLILIPVMVQSMTDNPTFTHVEDNVSFPLPSSSELDNYIVYIGFDPLATEAANKPEKPKPKLKHRPKPSPAPATD